MQKSESESKTIAQPTKKINKVTQVLRRAVEDVAMMCQFNNNGETLYSIKKAEQAQTEQKIAENTTKMFCNYLIDSRAGINYGLDPEDTVQEASRIWKLLNSKYQAKVLLQCQNDPNFFIQNNSLKIEDQQM